MHDLCFSVITRTPNSIASAEPGLRRSLQLPCVFEMRKTTPLSNETETVLLNVRLLLPVAGAEGAQRPQTESLPADNLPSFIVQGELCAQRTKPGSWQEVSRQAALLCFS